MYFAIARNPKNYPTPLTMLTSFFAVLFWISAMAIVYAQVGYPLLMRVLASLFGTRKKPVELTTDQLPSVSLIIPAYNEEVVLEAKLKNSLEIDYPRDRLEILVASDGSKDATNTIARGFENQGIRLLDFQQNRGKASAMNDTVSQASGDVLCLCDANVMFKPEALRILVNCLADDSVGAATGDVRLLSDDSEFGDGESLYYRLERRLQIDESLLGSTIGVDGGMYVMRKNLYRPLPPDTVIDDFKTSINVIKSKKRLIYEPAAVAIENGTPKSSDEFRRRIRVAAGAAQSLKRGDFPPPWQPWDFFAWVSHKFLRWTGPLWLCSLAISSAWLWNAGWIFQLAIGCQVLVYLLSLLAWKVPALQNQKFCKIAFYFTLSQIAIGWGLIKGAFLTQSGAWKRTARTAIPSTKN